MKKVNLTIIASLIAALIISIFAFQPTSSEASNNFEPLANPTPRKIRSIPAPTPSPVTIKRKAKSTNFSWGVSNAGSMSRRKHLRRKSKRSN